MGGPPGLRTRKRPGVCGSDLWPYKSAPLTDHPRQMGHEFIGVVEETGPDVTNVEPGDLVVAPFT
jgi:threonine dehydrogenase-like Zn-dependent dehydrogenase